MQYDVTKRSSEYNLWFHFNATTKHNVSDFKTK